MRFCIDYGISGADTFTNTFVFMALAMVLARAGLIRYRKNRLTAAREPARIAALDLDY